MEITPPVFFTSIAVVEESQPGAARREAARIAALQGMSEHDVGRATIVVTEAAKNLVKHGRGGEMLLRGASAGDGVVLDMLALDKGSGMTDVAACLQDGYSTAGTPGTGLGAMQRLSDVFEVYSVPGGGTAVHCRISGVRDTVDGNNLMENGVVMVPYAGESRCGDSWAERHTDSHSIYMVVDGLGHGAGAAEAADEALAAFQRIQSVSPLDIMDEAHFALRKTRGAAISIAAIDRQQKKVRFAGVGNVGGAISVPGKSQSMVTNNGIVGHTMGRLQDFVYDWPASATLAMYSDGIGSSASLVKYPGLLARSPLLGAAVLYRDFSRHRDDATVLLAREKAARN